jgi:peptidoglycan hydrolase-like protein with peptidoglycan-binding domain
MKIHSKIQPIRSLLMSLSLLGAVLLPFSISPAQAQVGNIVADGRLSEYYSPNTAPLLYLGLVGPVVTDMQYFLGNQGLYNGAADGIYGDATYEAVVNFQQSQGLVVDGVVGSETWAALFAADGRVALAQ